MDHASKMHATDANAKHTQQPRPEDTITAHITTTRENAYHMARGIMEALPATLSKNPAIQRRPQTADLANAAMAIATQFMVAAIEAPAEPADDHVDSGPLQ